MKSLSNPRALPGVVLVVLGIVLLVSQWFELTGAAVLGAIATVFLVTYAAMRNYGFLIPGMIIAGLAVGVGVQDAGYDPQGGFVLVGLAGGFLAIYAIDVMAGHLERWWPLIPGTINAVIGAAQVTEGTAAADAIARFWPIVLVVAGIAVLSRAIRSHETPSQLTP